MVKCRFGAFVMAVFASMASGCSYLNGDVLLLSAGQRKVVLDHRFSTFGDVEYSFENDNLPFCFEMTGCHEFGHFGHFWGNPDLSSGGVVKRDSVLRFSVHAPMAGNGVEFLVSNGVMRVVGGNSSDCRVERRTGPYQSDVLSLKGNARWNEAVEGRSFSIVVWQYGFSVRIHNLGEYGVVYNYEYPVQGSDPMRLFIYRMENLRLFHWPSL